MATRERIAAEARAEVEDLLYAYADCLDHGDITKWADFFTDDCLYKLISKENWTSACRWVPSSPRGAAGCSTASPRSPRPASITNAP